MNEKKLIEDGNVYLGLEFGSTRIKACLTDSNAKPLAEGSFTWENQLKDGIWTYPLELIHQGLQDCYADLKKNVLSRYGVVLKNIKAMGISAMMHGYLAFDKNDNLLVPFRTWRNTITKEASEELSELFNFPVPERWSVSHLYQAILNKEEHVKNISYVMTLAAYIHYLLTQQKVIGAGDASGMFPITKSADKKSAVYNEEFCQKFENLPKVKELNIKINDVFPKILLSGEKAGSLSQKGAAFLDKDGDLASGTLLCPPEGDAGTGMVATNAVKQKTGNISAGTSVFAMVVLEKALQKSYNGIIDVVTTPDAEDVAMVHANNCTGEHNYWVNFIKSAVEEITGNKDIPAGKYFDTLIMKSLEADKDCGGLISYNYLSGESITNFSSGRPLFARSENANFTLANFMRSQMFSSLGALRIGMDILYNEQVKIDSMTGAGGYFKTEAGCKYMAAALKTKINITENAGEGGPWGMAILAIYSDFCNSNSFIALADFLNDKIFASSKITTTDVDKDISESFEIFLERYKNCLAIEKAAVESLK
ncbi:MAG: FGGY-family carbohydrate kinase [Spirochaetales bacterium]|nr:FGGY-family carbohydrate kinase [Spirochaetales bacterium]